MIGRKLFSFQFVDESGGLLFGATPVLEKIHFLLDRLGVVVTDGKFVGRHWELTITTPLIVMGVRISDADANMLTVSDDQLFGLVHQMYMNLTDQFIRRSFQCLTP